MTVYKIILERESNPEFYVLADEQKSLMDRWNDFDNQLHNFKMPKLWLFKTKGRLRPIGTGITQLQKDFINWYGRVRGFCYEPSYTIGGTSEEKLITYLHSTATLRDLMNKLDSDMLMLAQNFNDRSTECDNRFNFLIAMEGVVLALIGIVIAVIGVVVAL